MKLIIKTNILKKIINKLNSIIAEFDPISENTGIFVEGFENKIVFKAKNKNINLKTELNIENEFIGDFLIKSKTFNEAINKINSDEIEIIKNKNNSISLKNEYIKYNLNLLSGNYIYLPKNKENFKKIFEIDGESLKKQIRSILFCASDKNTRLILRSINFRINKNKMLLIASDETKMGFSTNELDTESENKFSISLPIIKDLLKIIDSSMVEFYLYEDELILINGNTNIELKILENDYPNVLKFIPSNFEKIININKKVLFEAFSQAMLINSIKQINEMPIKFSVLNNVIFLETQDEGIGNVSVKITDYEKNFKEDFYILFNPKFFVETLKSIEEEEVVIKFNSSDEPFLISAKENDLHQVLILPFGRG